MTTRTSLLATARTALFTPALRPDRVLKAAGSGADVVIVDLEDAVAASDKDVAREHLIALLSGAHEVGRLGAPVAVRVNSPSTEAGRADLAALRRAARPNEHSGTARAAAAAVGAAAPGCVGAPDLLDAVLVPKLDTAAQLREVRDGLGFEIGIAGTVESAAGLLALEEITAQAGLVRLAVGALDLAFDLGCSADSRTMAAAMARVVTVSRARGLAGPLDSPTPQFHELDPVRTDSARARQDGFTGKLCIHPAQIPAAAGAFAPTDEDIAWAHSVVDAADGASAVGGSMVDAPVIARARRVLVDDGSAGDG